MRPRKIEPLVRPDDDPYGEIPRRVSHAARRLTFLGSELLLLAILIAGASLVLSAVLSDRTERPQQVSLKDHKQLVEAVAFSPDGQTLASCGWDHSVRLWDLTPLKYGKTTSDPVVLPHDSVRFALAFSPDGSLLAAAGHDSVTIWSRSAGKFAPRTRTEGETFRCLAFSPDGQTLALGCDDGSIRLWDCQTDIENGRIRAHLDVVRSLAFSPDGRYLVSSGQNREITLWDPVRRERIRSLGESGGNPVQIVAYSPDGKDVAVGECSGNDVELSLIDAATGAVRKRLGGHRAGISALAYSPDGATLATAGSDRCIKLWNLKEGKEKLTLTDGIGQVKSLAFSHDGVWLAYAGSDYTVRMWDVSLQTSHRVGQAPLKI